MYDATCRHEGRRRREAVRVLRNEALKGRTTGTRMDATTKTYRSLRIMGLANAVLELTTLAQLLYYMHMCVRLKDLFNFRDIEAALQLCQHENLPFHTLLMLLLLLCVHARHGLWNALACELLCSRLVHHS